MKFSQSTMSAKNQIVIPASVRKALSLKAGDSLNWQVIQSGQSKLPKVIAEPIPDSWADHTRGLGKDIWQAVKINTYINNLRNEWQSQE